MKQLLAGIQGKQGKQNTVNRPLEKTYHISSWLFLRMLAMIYLAAFSSMSVQITGLVGNEGILPLNEYLHHAGQQLGHYAWLRVPTVFWLDNSNTSLLAACYAGMGLSLLLLIGRFQLAATISLFLLYLSIFHAGQTFLDFQWDYLLLEAGFLSIFLTQGNNRLIIFLFHWLLFRLRFQSGLSKTGDPSWMDFTTLNYYFETQPLPHLGAWYFHQLPDWLLRFGTGFTLFVELIVPFFIFLPRRFRLFAAFSTILLQLLIIASSNHNWINLITIAFCLFLLDDRLMSSVTPKNTLAFVTAKLKKPAMTLKYFLPVAAAVVISTSVAISLQVFARLEAPEVFRWVRAYGIGNAYHVFPTMQTQRYEFLIEGSHDGINWQAYEFKFKPHYINRMPPFIVPHQPRLDWMIWFVPTKIPELQTWFDLFIEGLGKNNREITSLLQHNPFNEQAPQHIRVSTFQYEFTSPQEHDKTGAYWKTRFIGFFPFVPPRRP